MKLEWTNSKSISVEEHHLKSFGLTDSLYKGTALSAIIICNIILARAPSYKSDNIFLSTFIHFAFIGLLELPTSFLADMFDCFKVTTYGFVLKIFSTLAFLLFAYYAINDQIKLAIMFLIAESFLDGLANSLLSGAYQSSFIKKLRASNITIERFFLKSLKYSLPTRLLIPTGGVLLIYSLKFKSQNDLLFLVLYILALRIVTLARILQEFKGLSSRASLSSKNQYFKELLSTLKDNKLFVFRTSYYSLIAGLTSAYFLPSLQFLFKSSELQTQLLYGSFLIFLFYVQVILLSWLINLKPHLLRCFNDKQILFTLLLSIACLIYSTHFLENTSRQVVSYIFIFSIYFNSFIGQRISTDILSELSLKNCESGVISSCETFGMIAFCIFSVIGLLQSFSIPSLSMLYFCLIIGAILLWIQLKSR